MFFFVVWNKKLNVESINEKAKELGLIFQSLHAPWEKTADMWNEDEIKAAEAVQELKKCVDVCEKYRIPILVVHAFVGFEDHNPTELGLERFHQVIEYAQQKIIKIAFENTEGEEYLNALLEHFKENSFVGFCWDTGHEMCYNQSRDMMALYGDKLIGTHLNDNLGIKDFTGKITWLDDLHLLPFDGIADWDSIVQRLCRYQFEGPLS